MKMGEGDWGSYWLSRNKLVIAYSKIYTNIYHRMQIVNLGLPKSALGLVPDTGVMLSIGHAYINLHGNWRVKYLRIM